jgi:hypothetical protein
MRDNGFARANPPFSAEDGDVARAAGTKPHYTSRKEQHSEGCCFVPDGLLVTGENRDIFPFTAPAFRAQ